MPIDNWFILSLFMIFSSIFFCGILPMIVRLWIARRRYRRYRLDLQIIADASPEMFLHRPSIYSDTPSSQTNDQRRGSRLSSIVYTQLPFIDDETAV